MADRKTTKKSKSVNTSEKTLSDMFGELMGLLGLKSEFEVINDTKNDAYLIDIKGEDETGLIIGARGKTLSSLQMLTGLMFKNATGEWKRIIINVSDYREKEEGRLMRLAEQTAQRALESGETQNLYNLTAAQRRIVHMTLSENPNVVTESEGEGADRYLTVSPKK
jgi:spoIIIJ-associated protein